MIRPLAATALCSALVLGCAKKSDKPQPTEKVAAEKQAPAAASSAPAESKPRPGRPGKPDVPAPDNVAAAPADAKKLDSGVAYTVLTPSTGLDAPRPFDEVETEFVIWSQAGRMLDRSREGQPTKLFVYQLMPGMADLVADMNVGEKRRAWIPAELGFNDARRGAEGAVTVEASLVSVRRVPEPPPTPSDVAAIPEGAETTASGIGHKLLSKAEGEAAEKPTERDTVEVHYTGWTTDGRLFDSSIVRGEPAKFALKRVIPGWTEGLQLMAVGEKRRFWIPEALAYRGRPGAPKGMLVFDVELKSIEKAPEPPKTPKDVAAPPSKAKKTKSGLASIVLAKGKGDKHPGPTSNVKVHYSGWTTDGKMFDSSVTRGRPITFGLDRVIPGWTEGVQLMVEGEKRRFWIPEELAYKGRPGAPQGMLVFDVELLEVLD